MNINILLNEWLNIIDKIKQVDDYKVIEMNDDTIKVNFNFRNGLFSKEEYKNTERKIQDYLVNNSMFHKDFDTRSYLPMRVNEIEKIFIEIFGGFSSCCGGDTVAISSSVSPTDTGLFICQITAFFASSLALS